MTERRHEEIFIGGRFVSANSSDRIDLVNPANEERFASVVDADERDVDHAVGNAREALASWRETTVAERCGVLNSIAEGIAARAEEMDALVTEENGAPVWWAKFVGSGGQFIYRMAAGEAMSFERNETKSSPQGTSIYRNDPIGVVAAIVPWNSPQVLIASKLGPALAAGCTVVLKPSPETTLDAFLLADIMSRAGVPEGVVNVVSGGRETGAALVRHSGVNMVSFTGSSRAGREIASVCGSQLKRVSAELGGKSAAIVLDDADLSVFGSTILSDLFPYSGQVCYANTRVLVHRSRMNEVLDLLTSFIASSPVGDPTDPTTIFGPVVSQVALDKVMSYIESGKSDGARVLVGGARPAQLDRGYFVEPTIFVDVDSRMSIYQDEIFGPVLCVLPFDDDDEAIRLANDSDYGLAGSIFGADIDRANSVAMRLETGRVAVNAGKGSSRYSSLYKGSGLGSVGEMGPGQFLQPKNLMQPS